MTRAAGAALTLARHAAFGSLLLTFVALPLNAQEPPDSVVVSDSLAVVDSLSVADSLAVDSLSVADSLVVDSLGLGTLAVDSLGLDSLGLAFGVDTLPDLLADTLATDSLSADTIFYNIPSGVGDVPTGFSTGVWEWDRHGIMASGANTLAELFQDIPGLIALLGGDYGTPAAMSAFGQGGAGYRVFRDGFEVYSLDGGVADLQRIGLVGVSRIRLDRSMGQMIVDLTSHEYDDGRPFSVIEAGTGDLSTNMFRGVFADPTALAGSLAAGLERIDTRGRGPGEDEAGNRTGSWLRYQFHVRDRFGVGLEFRGAQSQTKVGAYTPTLTRKDAVVRAGLRVVDGVVVSAYAGRSTLVDGSEVSINRFGGTREQVGGALAIDLSALWLKGAYRQFAGDLPARSIDASGGYALARWGGVSGRYAQATWNGTPTSSFGGRAWLTPVSGLTVFGSYADGQFGSREAIVMDGTLPPEAESSDVIPGIAAITDRTTARGGVSLSAWGGTLAGAALYARSDLALPLGTELDYGAPAQVGVHRNGYEALAIVPTRWAALTLHGSYQKWDEPGPYLPEQTYRGSFEYHKVFKESGNLELWFSLGVRGHDPMLTFVADDGSGQGGVVEVPFYQNWYGRIQVRVVTVRLWLGMENATLRRENQNYPERLLPYARSFFALRWDLWN